MRPIYRGPSILLLSVLVAAGCESSAISAPPADFFTPPPSTVVGLAAGEFQTLSGAQAVAPVDLPPASETQTFLVAVQNASDLASGALPLRFSVRRVDPISVSAVPSGSNPIARSTAPRDRLVLDDWYQTGEVDFRHRVQRELVGARRATIARKSAPILGQTMELRSPVTADGSLETCTSTERVTGVVRAVSSRFAIVEDTTIAGKITGSEYATFLTEVENFVAPISEAYFGAPSDVDGNGVVIVLVTSAVNRLGAAGFFTASDLAAVEDCAASNEGEVLWLIGPDPTGRFGGIIPTGLVKDRLVGVLAHELQHLVHAGRRSFEGGGELGTVDEPWLNEGLSHIAEEVTGLFVGGLRTGANLDLADLADPVVNARFRRYHLGDLAIMANYLESTTNVPLIQTGPITRTDFSRARGFGYLFLRWVADKFAAGGPPGLVGSTREEAFFRALTLGGPSLQQSTSNIESALSSALGVSTTWEQLLSEYAAMPAVDDFADADVPLAPILELDTWNLQAIFENARDHGFELVFPAGFPLTPTILSVGTLPPGGFTESFELLPSSVYYIRLEAARETPLVRMTVSDQTGALITDNSDIQITIVRTF